MARAIFLNPYQTPFPSCDGLLRLPATQQRGPTVRLGSGRAVRRPGCFSAQLPPSPYSCLFCLLTFELTGRVPSRLIYWSFRVSVPTRGRRALPQDNFRTPVSSLLVPLKLTPVLRSAPEVPHPPKSFLTAPLLDSGCSSCLHSPRSILRGTQDPRPSVSRSAVFPLAAAPSRGLSSAV